MGQQGTIEGGKNVLVRQRVGVGEALMVSGVSGFQLCGWMGLKGKVALCLVEIGLLKSQSHTNRKTHNTLQIKYRE